MERRGKSGTVKKGKIRRGGVKRVCFLVTYVYTPVSRDSTNQKHYPDLGCDESSVSSFCARFSEVISRGNQWWRHQMSAVF